MLCIPSVNFELPDQLAKIWASFVFDVVGGYDSDPIRARLLFLISPHLINLGVFPFVGGRTDFRDYRRHLHSLSNDVYLNEQLRSLLDQLRRKPEPQEKPPEQSKHPAPLSETHLASLCARGEYNKCYQESDTSIAPFTPEVAAKIQEGIPTRDLPTPIPVTPADIHEVTFAEVREAFRKLKKGKAAGHSGWNRELLYPVVVNPPPAIRVGLAKIFNDFVNGSITTTEANLFRSLVVIPMTYKSKPGKLRSIMITDGIVKLCWHILMLDIVDERVDHSGQVFNQRGQATLAVCAIQAAVDRGEYVVSLDAVNAFPTLRRESFMEYIRTNRQYSKLKAFTNLMYANQATARFFDASGTRSFDFSVTTGCLQGCVSGPRFYSIGTIGIEFKHRGKLVMVADDTYVIGEDSLRTAEQVIQDFALIGQKLDGPKMKIIMNQARYMTKTHLPETLKPAAIVTSHAIEVLGGFINLQGRPNQDVNGCPELKEKLVQLEKRCEKILALPMTLQCKMLVLRFMSRSMIYKAQTYFHPNATQFFKKVDGIFLNAVAKLVRVDASHTVRIFSPIEDGGLGLYPYDVLHPFLQSQTIANAERFLARLKLDGYLPTPPTLTNSLLLEWKRSIQIPRGGGVERDGRSYLKKEFHSWLECRPNNTAPKTPAPGQCIRAAMTERFQQKIRKYEKFASMTTYRVVPFVMSIYGVVCAETRKLVETWRRSATDLCFLYDLYNNVQMNLIRAQHEMIRYVETKGKLKAAQRIWAGTG